MAWPTPQDYNEAVQNPRYVFGDPELQAGCCEVSALGLPRPITGNFASVYRIHCPGKDWAVRCFWREFSDMQQRYGAISAHLNASRLPYTVGFEYQPRGIKIRGTWYPILKMEWVEGQLLNDYLASHLHDTVALQALEVRWANLVSDLERAACAHGDLQHGNVLVVNGDLKLVDYDGMFVPALVGMGSHELGHQHYQHPRRAAGDFSPQLDRFSAWVIFLSISALRVDPSLWGATQAGDERLLLRREDFEDPESSASLMLLTEHADSGLKMRVLIFRALLDKPLHAVPSLSSALQRPDRRHGVGALSVGAHPGSLRLGWMSLVPSFLGPGRDTPATAMGSHPAWVIEYLTPDPPQPGWPSSQCVRSARVRSLAAFPIVGVGGGGLIAVGLPTFVATPLLFLVWSIASIVACVIAYRRDPAVSQLLPRVNREIYAWRGIVRVERGVRKATIKLETIRRRSARDWDGTAARTSELDAQETARLARLRDVLDQRLSVLDRRMDEINRRETAEQEMLLQEIQRRHVRDVLRRTSLAGASLRGIGVAQKVRLWSVGVWAAADVSSERIKSIQHLPHDQLMEVVSWRVNTETAARRTMPRQVSAAEQEELHRRYARERDDLEAERTTEQNAIGASVGKVQAAYARRRARAQSRLTRKEEDRTRRGDRLQTELLELGKRDQEYRSELEEVRQEMEGAEYVSFQAFLRSVCIPFRR